QGTLYLCGPAGLFAYSPDGKPLNSYRVGIDLPPAPLVQMKQGIAPDTGQMELWIATTGEGVLAFDGKRFRQMKPDRAEQRAVTSVLPLSTGRLLLGTAKAGVLSWDGKNLTPFHASLTNLNITA